MSIRSRSVSRIAVVALGMTLAAGSTLAVAQDISVESSNGGYAAAWSYGTNSKIGLADRKADGRPVKAEYNRRAHGTKKFTLWNKEGSGKRTYSGVGSKIWDARACVVINNWPDDCGRWWSDDHIVTGD
ncbi:hypothetical protein DCW30_18820 [Streptomyces alfalfae]|uniref:Lactococcin 972 family bacteriocin n=1 Tax=Streptomyces alfalfae TaxID=1642299 RepID=A0A4Q7ETS8_9ACTN|nr:hypothetical protein [Streptomyces alfalfae]AYA16858.1 hypothetical protein D3X13_12005 [Streptomyces fradiae]QQC91266.1 hypothetical protein I8755_24795 [Streptomyces alfalfae]QUI33761.1 hypothetical protein H9W91_25015 [Streptomyces alfalfae]RXX41482.1 hypothetical protein DCW30_18820 [Streptomyces alfalfae]RZM92610.1 hypothetical protein D4104_20745 [Streptomyces alfalfae]